MSFPCVNVVVVAVLNSHPWCPAFVELTQIVKTDGLVDYKLHLERNKKFMPNIMYIVLNLFINATY